MSSADWQRTHRDRMATLRSSRRHTKTCRQCKLPAKINPKTGKPMAMCEDHLADDRARAARRASRLRKAKNRA